MNAHLFTNALYQYLLSKNINVAMEAIQIQQQIDSMDKGAKRGIWKHIGKILNVNGKIAHNYYHNTWSTQFSDSLTAYRIIIKQMVLENPHLNNLDIVQKVVDMFPDKNFSKHSLQQIVYIQRQRWLLSPNLSHMNMISQNTDKASFIDSEVKHTIDGFSVDISQCVRFLDAVSM
ncbi:Conserved_hypothetical protein [Hexamita inflata]|uniref:Uncharacterized protein n=1 Tax=Hexamita inflata TaxID=28002 RepID=A0AA86TTH4_9EUKA|nr:Conserved hypothetical protein [Hexamita inflata]